jgi:hypothetical protein
MVFVGPVTVSENFCGARALLIALLVDIGQILEDIKDPNAQHVGQK